MCISAPANPEDVQVVDLSPRSFSLRWLPSSGCDQQYLVHLIPDHANVTMTTTPDGHLQVQSWPGHAYFLFAYLYSCNCCLMWYILKCSFNILFISFFGFLLSVICPDLCLTFFLSYIKKQKFFLAPTSSCSFHFFECQVSGDRVSVSTGRSMWEKVGE